MFLRALLLLLCSLAVHGHGHGSVAAEPPPDDASIGVLAGYELGGSLLDPAPSVRALLGDLLRPGEPYSAATEKQLIELLARLKYRVRLPIHRVRDDGRVDVTVLLAPVAVVRRIHVTGHYPLFADEILPRLRLRPGTDIPDDPKQLEAVLDLEAKNLEAWLARQGYFDARVSIHAEPAEPAERPTEFDVQVKLAKGPPYLLGALRVEGNESLPDAEIIGRVRQTWLWPLNLEDRFSKTELNESLESIRVRYQRRGFPGVRVTTTFRPESSLNRGSKRIGFTVVVREGKKIDVSFEGNRRIGSDRLTAALTLGAEGSTDDIEIERSAEELRKLYQQSGHYQATITWERVRLLPTFERILFFVDEGPRLEVRSISFQGNSTIPTARLRKVILTREFPGFYGLFSSGGFLTTTQLEQDVDAIVALYRREGYPYARVEATVAPHEALLDSTGALAAAALTEAPRGSLYVRFAIKEGARHVVAGVRFEGNVTTPAAVLANVVTIKRYQPLDAPTLVEDRARLVRYYHERGHPFATIAPSLAPTPLLGACEVVHVIDEGPGVRVGQIFARGNFKTADWVIRDALGLKTGEPLAPSRLRQAQENLRATGLFAGARLDLIGFDGAANTIAASDDPTTDADRTRVVHGLVEVQERYDDLGEVDLGGGYATDTLFFASLGYGVRNIAGVGASAVAKADLGQEIQYGRGDLRFPWWLVRRGVGLPLNLSLHAFARREKDERFDILLQAGAGLELSRVLSRDVTVATRYDLVRKVIQQPLVRSAGPEEEVDTTQVTIVTGAVGASVVLDRRTDARGNRVPIAGTRGYRLSGSASYASPRLLGHDEFIKLGMTAQHLFPLNRRILVTNGLRYDHGIPLDDSVLLPQTERFVAGGDTTVRGIEEDRLHTEVIRTMLPGGVEQVTVVPAGSNVRVLWNAEVQLQVWDKSVLGGLPIASAIFLDTGLVTSSLAGFAVTDLRHSLGVALARVVTPIGNFSIEYALPLDPAPGDDPTGRFHFNLGFVF